jgi:hypothetical protein
MPGQTEHILLCNFDFPPNQGIGGRRWAKLARGLADEGFIIHVLKARPVKGNIDSAWTAEVQHPNIQVNELPRTYPEIISNTGKDWISKLRYRVALRRLKKQESGTIYDVAIGWEEVFNTAAYKLITEFRITKVIATGAPWNLLVYAARLKKHFPSVYLIVDYRDPWITARNYGMPQLEPARMQVEKEKQSFVLSKSDLLLCPNEDLLEEIRASHEKSNSRLPEMRILAHSFDETDYADTQPVNRNDNKIVFVYGGALYVEMDKHLQSFRNFLSDLRSKDPELFNRMEFRIFTDNQKEAEPFRQYSNVLVSMPVGKKIFDELRSADFCLMLLSHHNRNFRTTKFYEFLPFRKPFVFIGEEGKVTQMVEQDLLGYVVRDFDKDLRQLVDDFDRRALRFNSSFDISSFTLSSRVKELKSLLQR